MAIWRIYKTVVTFTHSISDNPEVVDRRCLNKHSHTSFLEVHVKSDRWIDFKTIKREVEDILKQGYVGEIGVMDTETYVETLQSKVAHAMEIEKENVRIRMDETSRYAVMIE